MTWVFSEKISTRAARRPELEAAVKLAGEIRASGVAVTLVVHEHKRLGRGTDRARSRKKVRGRCSPARKAISTVKAARQRCGKA